MNNLLGIGTNLTSIFVRINLVGSRHLNIQLRRQERSRDNRILAGSEATTRCESPVFLRYYIFSSSIGSPGLRCTSPCLPIFPSSLKLWSLHLSPGAEGTTPPVSKMMLLQLSPQLQIGITFCLQQRLSLSNNWKRWYRRSGIGQKQPSPLGAWLGLGTQLKCNA